MGENGQSCLTPLFFPLAKSHQNPDPSRSHIAPSSVLSPCAPHFGLLQTIKGDLSESVALLGTYAELLPPDTTRPESWTAFTEAAGGTTMASEIRSWIWTFKSAQAVFSSGH